MEFNFRYACVILSAFGLAASSLIGIGAFCIDRNKTAIASVLVACVFAFLFGGML